LQGKKARIGNDSGIKKEKFSTRAGEKHAKRQTLHPLDTKGNCWEGGGGGKGTNLYRIRKEDEKEKFYTNFTLTDLHALKRGTGKTGGFGKKANSRTTLQPIGTNQAGSTYSYLKGNSERNLKKIGFEKITTILPLHDSKEGSVGAARTWLRKRKEAGATGLGLEIEEGKAASQ